MTRQLNPDECGDLHVEYDVDSYLVLAESLLAFRFPPSMRIPFNQKTTPCFNKKLLRRMKEEYGLTHYREFHLGGSGDFATYVLVMGSSSLPEGSKFYFLNRAFREGLSKLSLNTKTTNHGIPSGCDGSENLRLFAEDAGTVVAEIDRYIKGERELADPSNEYSQLKFFYYRAKHGIISTADVVRTTLRNIVADDVHVRLLQLHFGSVVGHPTLPIVLDATQARTTVFRYAKDVQYYRCYNSTKPTHMTAQKPFGPEEETYDYFQSYNPSFHAVKRMASANPTLHYVFGRYVMCDKYITRKMGFNENFVASSQHFSKLLKHQLLLRLEIVRNFDDLEDGLNALNNRNNGERDILFFRLKQQSCFGTFQSNWADHVRSTLDRYLQRFQEQSLLWERSHSIEAATEMYDSEIKIKYFLEGVARNLDYARLSKLLGEGRGGNSLTRGIGDVVTYPERVADQFKYTDFNFFKIPIPFSWFKIYTNIFLNSAHRYNYDTQPTLVYLKAVFFMCLQQYGPGCNTWSRATTHDFGRRYINYLLRYRRANFESNAWKVTGTIDPKCVWTALSSPNHSGVQMFLSAVQRHQNFDRGYLKRYVYTKIEIFPAFLITKKINNIHDWYEVNTIRPHLVDDPDSDEDDNNSVKKRQVPLHTHQGSRAAAATAATRAPPPERRLEIHLHRLPEPSPAESSESSSDQEEDQPSTSSGVKPPGRYHLYTPEEDSLILRFALEHQHHLQNRKTWNEAVTVAGMEQATSALGIRRRFLTLKKREAAALQGLGLEESEILKLKCIK